MNTALIDYCGEKIQEANIALGEARDDEREGHDDPAADAHLEARIAGVRERITGTARADRHLRGRVRAGAALGALMVRDTKNRWQPVLLRQVACASAGLPTGLGASGWATRYSCSACLCWRLCWHDQLDRQALVACSTSCAKFVCLLLLGQALRVACRRSPFCARRDAFARTQAHIPLAHLDCRLERVERLIECVGVRIWLRTNDAVQSFMPSPALYSKAPPTRPSGPLYRKVVRENGLDFAMEGAAERVRARTHGLHATLPCICR